MKGCPHKFFIVQGQPDHKIPGFFTASLNSFQRPLNSLRLPQLKTAGERRKFVFSCWEIGDCLPCKWAHHTCVVAHWWVYTFAVGTHLRWAVSNFPRVSNTTSCPSHLILWIAVTKWKTLYNWWRGRGYFQHYKILPTHCYGRIHRSATNCSKMSTDGAVIALPYKYLIPWHMI